MCILYWAAKLKAVGAKIQTSTNQLYSYGPEFYQTKMRDIDKLWKEFLKYQELLRSAGFQSKEYYSEVENHMMQYCKRYNSDILNAHGPIGCGCKDNDKLSDEVTQFLEKLKEFKDFLQTKRSAVESCKHPDILFHELKIRFELIKENFKKTSIVDDKKSQGEISEVITIYCEMLMEISEEINKSEKKATAPTPATINETPHVKGDGNLNYDLIQQNPTEELLLENFVEKIKDKQKLNINDPGSIKILVNSLESVLKSLTKMELSINTIEKFIAEKIIEKFDDETLTQYERCLKQSQEINVFEFLEYMMEYSQKNSKETRNSTNNQEKISFQRNVTVDKDKIEKERTEAKRSSLFNEQLVQGQNKQDDLSDANELTNVSQNAVNNKMKHKNVDTSQELSVFSMTSATGQGTIETHESIYPTLVIKPNEVSLFLPPNVNTISRDNFEKIYAAISEMFKVNKMPLLADHKQGLFEIRLNSLDDSNAKCQSDEVLETHIRNLRAGILVKIRHIDTTIKLNLLTFGLSEDKIREYYKSADAPTSLKAFITPLLQKATKLIIFPEDEQENPDTENVL